MIKFLLVLMFVPIPLLAEWLQTARDQFFRFDEGACKAGELYNYLEKADVKNDALYLAYKGVSLASSADCTINPAGKLRRFREGRKMLEEAINKQSNNPEIRFLRLSVQVNAPYFLGYSSDISNDRKAIIESIREGLYEWHDADFVVKVLTFVKLFASADAEQQLEIEELIEIIQKS